MRRRTPLLLALAAAAVLLVTALAWPRDGEPDDAVGAVEPGGVPAECLGDRLSDADACADLTARLDAQDPDAVDVVVLVPEGVDAGPVTDLVESAAQMRAARPGAGAAPVVTTETLAAGSAVPLLDPEVVVVAAVVEASDDPAAVALYDATGARCRAVTDAFALASWSGLPGFSSHHALPEGILRRACVDGSEEVCVAINATLGDPATGGDPFAAFALVADELGHCLDPGRADPARS